MSLRSGGINICRRWFVSFVLFDEWFACMSFPLCLGMRKLRVGRTVAGTCRDFSSPENVRFAELCVMNAYVRPQASLANESHCNYSKFPPSAQTSSPSNILPSAMCCVCCHPIYAGRQSTSSGISRRIGRGHTGGRPTQFFFFFCFQQDGQIFFVSRIPL